MLARFLILVVLALPISVCAASSERVRVDNNCKAWGYIAKQVADGRNNGQTKQEALDDVTKELKAAKIAQAAINDVNLTMGKMWDELPEGMQDLDEIFNATYLACWTRYYEGMRH